MPIIVVIGSPAWLRHCAALHQRRANRYSRLKYEADERLYFDALFSVQFWLTETPWK